MNIDCAMYNVTNKITGNNYIVFSLCNIGFSYKTTETIVADIIRNKQYTECLITKLPQYYPDIITRIKNKILYNVEVYYGNHEQWFG